MGPPLFLPGFATKMTPVPCGDRWLQVVPRVDAFPQIMLVPSLDTLVELVKILAGPHGGPAKVDPAMAASLEIIFDLDQLPAGAASLLEFAVPSPDGRFDAQWGEFCT